MTLEELAARCEALEMALRGIIQHFDPLGKHLNAPGHAHSAPGVWDYDSSNGVMAGQPCTWCAHWNYSRALSISRTTEGEG